MYVSDHAAKRMKEVISQTGYKVAAYKTSARFAISEWTKKLPLYHAPLFLLTILIRTLYGACPELRKFAVGGDWSMLINGQPLYKCCLCRSLCDHEAPGRACGRRQHRGRGRAGAGRPVQGVEEPGRVVQCVRKG